MLSPPSRRHHKRVLPSSPELGYLTGRISLPREKRHLLAKLRAVQSARYEAVAAAAGLRTRTAWAVLEELYELAALRSRVLGTGCEPVVAFTHAVLHERLEARHQGMSSPTLTACLSLLEEISEIAYRPGHISTPSVAGLVPLFLAGGDLARAAVQRDLAEAEMAWVPVCRTLLELDASSRRT